MKLRVGQKYVRNDGKVILISRYEENSPGGYHFIDEENGNGYQENGIHGTHEWDEAWNIAGLYVPKQKRSSNGR